MVYCWLAVFHISIACGSRSAADSTCRNRIFCFKTSSASFFGVGVSSGDGAALEAEPAGDGPGVGLDGRRSGSLGCGPTGVGSGLFSGNKSFVAGGGGVGTGTCWGSGIRSGANCTDGLGDGDGQGLPYAVAYGLGGGAGLVGAGEAFVLGEGDGDGVVLGVGVPGAFWPRSVKANTINTVNVAKATNAVSVER
jgi:hypothetical protein